MYIASKGISVLIPDPDKPCEQCLELYSNHTLEEWLDCLNWVLAHYDFNIQIMLQ